MKKLMVPVLFSALLFISCKNGNTSGFEIKLAYSNADRWINTQNAGKADSWVFLEQIVYGKSQLPLIIDSQKLSKSSGSLTFRAKTREQGIFELIIGENALAIPLINDVSEIQINADLGKIKDFYTVSGSPASQELQVLLDNVGRKNNEIQGAFNDLDSLKRINAPDSVLVSANITKNTAILELNNYLKNFIRTTNNATLGVLALGWASRSLPPSEMDSSLNNLKTRFPGQCIFS